jgi:hypothetical protein
MKRLLSPSLAVLLAATALAAPTSPTTAEADGIKIRLVPPRDIIVDWTPVAGAAGHIIEWGTKPDDDFVPLGFFPPGVNTYKHPDLMWETPNYYRRRAYFGPVSQEVEISLPSELSNAEYKRRYDQPEDYHWAGPVVVPDAKPVEKKSIRNPATAAAAAPTDFKITLQPVSVSGFKLTWTDHASDELGTMIELKKEGSSSFEVVALVEPNVNSFGWAFEPPVRKGVLRVRPYYYGEPSALVHLTTGKEPETTGSEPTPAPLAKPKS